MPMLILTIPERLNVAYMLAGPWAGPEEQLVLMEDIYNQVGLGELPISLDGRFMPPADFDPQKLREVNLSEVACAFLTKNLPPAPTPGQLGPAKVSLLRKLRGGPASSSQVTIAR